MFTGWAIDYFITPWNKYNWALIPPVVVGRTVYDNFMIAHSIAQNIPVLDATRTIFAMHQTLTNNYESRKGKKDMGINRMILRHGHEFHYALGLVDCAQFNSLWDNATARIVKTKEIHCMEELDKAQVDISLVRNVTVFRNGTSPGT